MTLINSLADEECQKEDNLGSAKGVFEFEGRMAMYNKILVPIDLSSPERAEAILKKAEELLDATGHIVLLNVVEDLPIYLTIDLPMNILENAVEDARKKLNSLKLKSSRISDVDVRSGSPAREILAAAEDLKTDLIIIASHNPDLSNYFIGATADRVVRHARCPVLIDR